MYNRKAYAIFGIERSVMMDPVKCGNFIASKRKLLHMTQLELGNKIHVTDKAISKWERGVSQTKGY